MVKIADCKKLLRANALLISTLVGVAVGFGTGFALREAAPSDDARMWIGLPGEIFLRLLKMLILPLIVSSVISGSASLDPRSRGRISLIALGYIAATNFLGCILGIILAVTIRPGEYASGNSTQAIPSTQDLQTQDIFADLIRNLFPDNIVTSCFQKTLTYYEITTQGSNESDAIYQRKIGTSSGSNIVGIIFCSVALGIATSSIGEEGRLFYKFFKSAMGVILKLLRWFLWLTPIGCASLIAVSIISVDNLAVRFQQLGMLIVTVTAGLLFQQLIFIPFLYFICFFENPLRFLFNVFPAWSISFASSTTAVAIPEIIHCCEEGHGVDKRVSRFVVPFSVALSANGAALFLTTAAIFIGQINNLEVDAGKIIAIGVLSTVAVMALPNTPSAAIVVLIVILENLSFPVEDVALLLAVEWFLDRIRTASSGVSHAFCAIFTYRWCKNSLPPLEEEDEETETQPTELNLTENLSTSEDIGFRNGGFEMEIEVESSKL